MAKKDAAKKVEETTEKALNPAQEAPKAAIEIIRGRMPVAVVAMIRFKETGMTTSAIAAKYRTTIGKVDDISKGRNFGYVTGSFAPSAQQVTDAMTYLEQLSDENALSAVKILEGMGLAEDGGEAFEAARKASRKTSKKTEEAPAQEGEVASPSGDGTDDDAVEETDMDEFTE